MRACYELDLEHSKPIFLHALQLTVMDHNTKFGNKMFRGSENIIWINIDILTLCCDLERRNPLFKKSFFFHKVLWLTLMHHKTKFGCRRISSLEDIIWANIH